SAAAGGQSGECSRQGEPSKSAHRVRSPEGILSESVVPSRQGVCRKSAATELHALATTAASGLDPGVSSHDEPAGSRVEPTRLSWDVFSLEAAWRTPHATSGPRFGSRRSPTARVEPAS